MISLNQPRKLGSHEQVVWNPGADMKWEDHRRVWENLESAQGDKRKEILVWVEGEAHVGAGGKGQLPLPSSPRGSSLDACLLLSPTGGPAIHPALGSQNPLKKM